MSLKKEVSKLFPREGLEELVKAECAESIWRLTSAKQIVADSRYDAYIVFGQVPIHYFSGQTVIDFERPHCIVFFKDKKKPVFVPAQLEVDATRSAVYLSGLSALVDIAPYFDIPSPEGRDWYSVISNILKQSRVSCVGLEGAHGELIDGLNGGKGLKSFFNISVRFHYDDLIKRMQTRRSQHSIEQTKRVCMLAELVARETEKLIVPGTQALVSWKWTSELPKILCSFWPKEEFNWPKLHTYAGAMAGPRTDPHSAPRMDEIFQRGVANQLLIAINTGYAAELERCRPIGTPLPRVVEAYDAVVRATIEMLRLCRPGVSAADIGSASREVLRKAGYSDEETIKHRTGGHGIVSYTHDLPVIGEGGTDVLEENMIFSLEPGVYQEGSGQVRDSNTYLMTDKGAVNLTPYEYMVNELLSKEIGMKVHTPRLTQGKYVPETLNPGRFVSWYIRRETKKAIGEGARRMKDVRTYVQHFYKTQ